MPLRGRTSMVESNGSSSTSTDEHDIHIELASSESSPFVFMAGIKSEGRSIALQLPSLESRSTLAIPIYSQFDRKSKDRAYFKSAGGAVLW